MDVNLGTGVLSRCASLMIMIGCAIVGQAPREPSTQVAQGPCDQAEQKPMLCHQCYHFLPFQRVRQHVCHPYSGIIISHIPADGWNLLFVVLFSQLHLSVHMQLWDSSTSQVLMEYEEHEKRAWSEDFSWADPTKLASGSAVLTWSMLQSLTVLSSFGALIRLSLPLHFFHQIFLLFQLTHTISWDVICSV
jgi:hypothetical protein